MEVRTDLALEVREKYENDNVEIDGVSIKEIVEDDKDVKTTIVNIFNNNGATKMGRPIGEYVTIENIDVQYANEYNEMILLKLIKKYLKYLTDDIKEKRILVVGLGNQNVTPDALGPLVVEQIFVTRHLIKEYGYELKDKMVDIAAISPGVMGQTGMEAIEVIKSLVKEIGINIVIVIDALASCSVNRLNTTIQITNTGIAPGSGVGNNRKALNKESIGAEVIAIGVPTVVDAMTIMNDMLKKCLEKEGYSQQDTEIFINEIKGKGITNMFVTPKNIDELIKKMSEIIAHGINGTFSEYNISVS